MGDDQPDDSWIAEMYAAADDEDAPPFLDDGDVRILFRPVGRAELDLIAAAGYRRFPPRLSFQPIFYPVLLEEYARQIAREWNTKDAASGQVGYVTRFAVEGLFLERYEPQNVGGRIHWEYWVPAEELEAFNEAIRGTIEVIAEYLPE